MRLIWFWLLICLPWGVADAADSATGERRHVVLVVWDGMRPDLVTPENTPTLWKLAQQGVVFRNHHPVYLSATNVNGVALATGMYPAHSDLIANHEFRPRIDSRKPVDVENPQVLSIGDEISRGAYLAAPTLAQIVQRAGQRSIIAASKTVGLLLDRPSSGKFANESITVSAGNIWPNEAAVSIIKPVGLFPKGHRERDRWTTQVLTEVLWKDNVPAFSLLWLGEPDLTQHETAPGAPEALRAIKSSDDQLAEVIAALDRHQIRKSTDMFVVSDHGFSTIQREVALPTILADAGFKVSTEFKSEPAPGEVMLVGGGGSALFYVIGHQPAVVQRLVEFLQKSDFAGVIFTREPAEGTFTLDKGQINSSEAPDVVMAFRGSDQPNQYGVSGMIDADWQRAAGKGTHATLNRSDMHNLLIAAGPDFQRGQMDDLPTGNVDLAPTILRLLRIPPPQPMDGRILTEALIDNTAAPAKPETHRIDATRALPTGTWHQWLHTSHVGNTVYLDDGNGAFQAAK